MVRNATAEDGPVADVVAPDALRVRLEAAAVARDGGDRNGDVVRGAVAGGLEGQSRAATLYAALVAGGAAAVASYEARGSRVEANICCGFYC